MPSRTTAEHASVLRKAGLEAKLSPDELMTAALQLVAEEIIKVSNEQEKRLLSLIVSRAILEIGKMSIEQFYSKPSIDVQALSPEALEKLLLVLLAR